MPEATFSVVIPYATETNWAFRATRTATGETAINAYSSQLGAIRNISPRIVVDGLNVLCVRAGGGITYTPGVFSQEQVNVADPLRCYLDTTTTAASVESHVWTNIGIPVTLDYSSTETQIVLRIVCNTVAIDVFEVSVWGRYQPQTVAPAAPAPVSVAEIQVWPWRR